MLPKILLFLAPFVLSACQPAEGYKIEGKLKGLNDGQVILKHKRDGHWIPIDSTKAEDGVFSFNVSLEAPEICKVSLETIGTFKLFVENSDIEIAGNVYSLNNLDIKGSDIHKSYSEFKKKVRAYNREINSLWDEYLTARKEGKRGRIAEIHKEEYQAVSENKLEYIKEFVKDRTNSVLSTYIICRYLFPYLKYKELDSTYKSLDDLARKSIYAKKLKERCDLLSRVQAGKPFIDFTLPNPEGNSLTLSDYIGNGYVLLNFWASWCGPCRKEKPNFVKNYEKYHEKGFEIFEVALDVKKEAWVRAIEDDNLTWPQVSELNGWDGHVSEKYGLMAIPANALLNEEGKIVARDLYGEELDKKLKEIYENE